MAEQSGWLLIHSPFFMMLVVGIAGGILSLTTSDDKWFNKTTNKPVWSKVYKHVSTGILAVFMVPLFLQMIGSAVLNDISKSYHQFYVFLGICSAAAFTAQRFASTVSDKLLKDTAKQVKENKEAVDEIEHKAKLVEVGQLAMKATVSMMEQKYDQAINHMNQYIKLMPQDSNMLWRKAFCSKRVGDHKNALDSIELAIKYASKNSETLIFNKACYMSLLKNNISKIIQTLEEAISINKKNTLEMISDELKNGSEGDFSNIQKETEFIAFMDKYRLD